MRKLGLSIVVGSSLALFSAHVLGGNLEGLEMDVMDANEAPDDAVSRITLPGADPAIGGNKPEDAGLITDSARQSGKTGVLDARAPELATESARGATETAGSGLAADPPADMGGGSDTDTDGSVVDGTTDPGVVDGTTDPVGSEPGVVSGEPGEGGTSEPGVVGGEPGEGGISEPDGTINDLPVEELPPLEAPPPAEAPPGDWPPIGEQPPAEVPIGGDPSDADVPGDPGDSSGTGGSEGQIEPPPVEKSAGSELGAGRNQ
jgi:hypothetical protein